ncbi:MAG: FecR domain-containing protein [candidate division Zixibacteria bacterium]|nr:FecR domain-containing protein [Candidatus Tariuqbacter arcticus]
MKRIIVFNSICLLFTLFCFPNSSWAQIGDTLTITVKADQSIREIAEEYLGDPDLWRDILRANNVNSAADIEAGMTLNIPVKSISRANNELKKALELTQAVDEAGAKIFAAAIIDSAINLRNQAIEARKAGDWDGSFRLARLSTAAGQHAYEICLANKEVAGQATVHYRQGTVQNRTPSDLMWNSVVIGAILIEEEKVRTLSKSFAEILFLDQSRLRLEENSQVLIQEMRVNLLENRNKSTIGLIEGDFYALLGGGSASEEFKLEVPGVETDINSDCFRIGMDKEAARFANYDGKLGITSAGQTVVLEQDQGSIVKHNQPPTSPHELLSKVKLLSPEDGSEFYEQKNELAWESIPGASQYRLEIARDKSFSQIVYSNKLSEPSFSQLSSLESGVYHWRVSAQDDLELAGPYSYSRAFRITIDDQPPYLLLNMPKDNELVFESAIVISGETEKGAVLTINGEIVEVDQGGAFSAIQTLQEGANEIILQAIDHAGNITELCRKVTFKPSGTAGIVFDPDIVRSSPDHFLVANQAFLLSGKVEPGFKVTIHSLDYSFSANTFADELGNFQFSIFLEKEAARFTVTAVSPSGDSCENNITVEIDEFPPKIILGEDIPTVMAQSSIILKGRVEGGEFLFLNGVKIPLEQGEFKQTLQIEPGDNHISLTAVDAVGNETEYSKDIFCDNQPPKLLKYEFSPKKVSGGGQVQILVYAEDHSGLKKAAAYSISIGDFAYSGYLRFSSASGRFEGTVSIPVTAVGTMKLTEIKLEDKLGNAKVYGF